jgi:hypothetical protein
VEFVAHGAIGHGAIGHGATVEQLLSRKSEWGEELLVVPERRRAERERASVAIVIVSNTRSRHAACFLIRGNFRIVLVLS